MRPADSFVEQPVRSLQTMLRVIAEDDHMLPTVVPDGIYGPATMLAVTAFQRRAGLNQTGIADQITWEQIVAVYEQALIRVGKAEPIEIVMDAGKIYRLGDRSPYILLLQSMLTQLSMDYIRIPQPEHTGILDEATSVALSEFQKLVALPVTGELDKITWKHLVRQFTLNALHEESHNRLIVTQPTLNLTNDT